MNKTILMCSVVLFVAAVNFGLSLRTRAVETMGQKDALVNQRLSLQVELKEKSLLKKKEAQAMSQAFTKIVNEINLVSTGQGLEMALVFPTTREENDLAGLYRVTDFRGIKGMPLDIKVTQTTGKMDVAAALDLVYLLEQETDMKISKIEQDGQEMRIQGMLYGI